MHCINLTKRETYGNISYLNYDLQPKNISHFTAQFKLEPEPEPEPDDN